MIEISTAVNPDTLLLHENNQAEPAERAPRCRSG
jgi:hypothetical protein